MWWQTSLLMPHCAPHLLNSSVAGSLLLQRLSLMTASHRKCMQEPYLTQPSPVKQLLRMHLTLFLLMATEQPALTRVQTITLSSSCWCHLSCLNRRNDWLTCMHTLSLVREAVKHMLSSLLLLPALVCLSKSTPVNSAKPNAGCLVWHASLFNKG